MSTASQELLQAWLFFPLVFVVASACLGMAIFQISRLDIKSLLVLPTGFAALVVLGQLTTLNSRVAPLTPSIFLICVLLSAIYFGFELLSWFKRHVTALTLGFCVFYVHGLPILMSGTPTFAGWIKLDDGAHWLALTDQLLAFGRNTAILTPSTHEANVQILLNPTVAAGAAGILPYPMGSFVPLGVFSKFLFIDPAWILQPFMAAAALILCVTFLALLKPIQIPTWSKFLTAFIAPLSALFLGYELWGGIKEALLVPIIVLATALIPVILEKIDEPRRIMPIALACSAYVLVISISGLVWLVAPVFFLAISLMLKTKKFPWKHSLFFSGTFIVCSLAPLIPLIKNPKGLIDYGSFAQSSSDIGNLFGPLKLTQIFGIWLTGDFRYPPEFPVINTALVLLAGLLFGLGCLFLVKTGNSHIAVLGIWVTLLSALTLRGNAWVSGKTLAMASPIVLFIAFCAIGFIANKFSIEAMIMAGVLSAGVLISYAHTYHEVWLAPFEQLKELETIGNNPSYSSPALMIEYSPYGSRHFLRKLDAESAGDLRRNLIPLRNGKGLDKGEVADIDEFALASIQSYETLVLRTSANSSRPPSNFELEFSGSFYEVWQKNPEAKVPVEHYPFGNKDAQYAVPECSFVESEIAAKLPGNDVVVSSAKDFIALPVTNVGETKEAGNESVYESKFEVAEAGDFDLWIEGWIKGRAKIYIDEKLVTTTSHVLNQSGNMAKIGDVSLQSGPHVLRVVTDSPWMIPGSGGLSYPMGPFYLSDQNDKYSVETVQPADLNSLCTRPVDWIELVPR